MEKITKKEFFTKRTKVESWQEAVKLSALPLLEAGYIKEGYIDQMIQTVYDLGSYIVLAPLFAMPHAAPSEDVIKTGFACMKLEEPVYFDSDEDSKATLILPIACNTGEEHMKMIQLIATVLGDEEKFERLLKSDDPKEMFEVFTAIN